MSMDDAPHAAGAIQQSSAIDRLQPASLCGLDDHPFVICHLGEGMPKVMSVPVSQPIGCIHAVVIEGLEEELPVDGDRRTATNA
jgi:hypothetical protein